MSTKFYCGLFSIMLLSHFFTAVFCDITYFFTNVKLHTTLLFERVRHLQEAQRQNVFKCVLIQCMNVLALCVSWQVLLCCCKSHFTRCLKLLCLLQSGIFNGSSQECHMLLDAIHVFPAKCSVLWLCNVGLSVEMLKYQVGFPTLLFGVYSSCRA